jgi:hypothetical protein
MRVARSSRNASGTIGSALQMRLAVSLVAKLTSPLLEIALVIVHFDYVPSRIVNANHGMVFRR